MIIKPKETKKYPEIIKAIKANFSRKIDVTKLEDYELTQSRKDKKEKDIWQRRYLKPTITDEEDKYDEKFCLD